MAQYALNAYDADVYIPEFKGIYTYGDQMGGDLRYAEEAMNVETTGGVLQANRAISEWQLKELQSGDYYPVDSNSKIVWVPEETVTPPIPNAPGTVQPGAPCSFTRDDVFLIFTSSDIYRVRYLYWHFQYRSAYNVSTLSLPDGMIYGPPKTWVNYEYVPDGQDTPVICCMMSFAYNGLVRYSQGTFAEVTTAPAEGKFDFMERYAERLWGIKGDNVYYSRPYDMSNWTEDTADPANGGGVIRLASWDGDKLTAMRAFGDCLVIFSKKRAWKIQGSDPSNFIIQEQYGNGCHHPDTLAVDNNRLLMIQDRSIAEYDGYSIRKISTDLHTKLFYTNSIYDDSVMDKATATIVEDHYLINVGGQQTLDYNTKDGTIVLKDYPTVIQFLKEVPIALSYYNLRDVQTLEHIEYLSILMLEESDLWEKNVGASALVAPTPQDDPVEVRATYAVSPAAAKWVSPWITLGREDIKKGGFEFYFTPEVLRFGMTFKISIQTEKKTKSKYYTVQPLSLEEYRAGKRHKMKRLHFGGNGRRFRVIIEVEEGNTAPWRLVGGIQMIAETDRD